ncbi:phosphoglycerate mutase family protein [Dactylonectria estremocensis]|uniref:Phosphoglycerate mutase family protein n=1 Tax=Dactylonectria estremocensis TaxID=1079267 RepID=A0A9P9D1N3_9HYPO|nr:phosphoglycerate mutase family protein [Dactylonectria estremocensis]
MASTIYLIRHADSVHNVSKDFSHRDPPLTELGIAQASALGKSFPGLASVAIVLTSPLTRTLETTLAAFSHILDKQSVGDGGIDAGARLVLDPDLQERSDLPCDTGSDRATLEEKIPNLDFGVLQGKWYTKDGAHAADDAAVKARAKAVRERLRDFVEKSEQDGRAAEGKGDVVVVTHGVFMKFLAEDETIGLPKAGWKAYTVGKREGGEVTILPVEQVER